MNLKGAIAWSVVVHGLLFLIRPQGLVQPAEAVNSIQVAYWKPPAPAAVVPEKEPIQKKAVPIVEEPQAKVAAEPRPVVRPISPPLSRMPVPPAPMVPKVVEPLPAPQGVSFEEVSLPEKEFAAVTHKQSVCRHLRTCLEYPNPFGLQGNVRLQIALGPSGSLKEVSVMESSDPRLAEAAVNGIRSAAPYPKFPKDLKESEVRYEFLVQYRPE